MRTNLVDGVIIGLGISLVILVAHWFLGENQVLEQAATIILGGVVLAIIQLWIDRRRMNTPPPAAPIANEPAPTPLATPRTPWATDLQAAADPPAADPPAASSAVPPTTPSSTPPEPTTSKPSEPQG